MLVVLRNFVLVVHHCKPAFEPLRMVFVAAVMTGMVDVIVEREVEGWEIEMTASVSVVDRMAVERIQRPVKLKSDDSVVEA